MRRRQFHGVFDDMYASAAGAASVVANDVESLTNWAGQEFNDFRNQTGDFGAQPGSLQAAVNANAAAGDYPPGVVAIINPIENALSNLTGRAVSMFDTILLLGAAGALIFYALEQK